MNECKQSGKCKACGTRSSRSTFVGGLLFLLLLNNACWQSSKPVVTLTVLDPEWLRLDELPRRDQELEPFTRETGIRLKHPPTPDTSLNQLSLWRRLLQQENPPDVLGIDVIWPGLLSDQLIDLKPYFKSELASMDPRLVASYSVGNKVVAIPYHALVGVLAYRADLLREYGYKRPPSTWDELERMAARIQKGERAKGKKDFWGFVWQGAATEGLTCNALEWQVSEGGGSVIENDGTISVNNPAAIAAWERARRWVGSISPPSVIAYRELDSSDVWDSGRAAFYRTWQWRYRLAHTRESRMGPLTGYTSLPRGRVGRAGALGGTGLAVASSSAHREEAIALIRFLIQQELQPTTDSNSAQPNLYDAPSLLQPSSVTAATHPGSGELAFRPSLVAGEKYEEVTRAYFETLHMVLAGKTDARLAANQLEQQLVRITGFKTGLPLSESHGRQ